MAKTSLATLYFLPIEFVPLSEKEATESLDIACKSNITYYDAVFVGLAERIGATLVTDNPKHQKVSGKVKVIQLKNYGVSKKN